jgi:glyoxylase-like metal-dependent hydrolase (beta-lactamase superfamily II)
MLPFAVVNTLGTLVTVESAIYDVALNAPVDPALLRRPERVPAAPARTQPTVAGGAQKVEEIVPGVYQILNVTPLYNVMLVRQDEDVLVIEAPGDDDAYDLVRDSARSVLGGRDITTLVLTHHHFDHTSNLWRYLNAGTKVIAPAGDEAFVRSVARAPRLDVRTDSASEPDLELVRGRRMVGTGPNRFELIDAGPNPHADEILIAYFPEHKLLWVPDIYGYLPGFTPPPLLLSFADRLEALDLDLETIATAHTELSSVAELRDMVARARASAGQPGGSDR